MISPARSWSRWRRLAWEEHTLIRSLQYEAIEGLYLPGVTLDIGGGSINSYHHLLRAEGRIESVNLDARVKPTHIWDLNLALPFEDGAYDNVISLNTFEHIYEDKVAIKEGLRVLRHGGAFHFLVPFLYRVHASPGDYHRHTAQWWQRTIIECGVPEERFSVTPLKWSSTATAACLRGLTGGVMRAAVMASAFVDPGDWARTSMELFGAAGKPWRPGAARTTAAERRLARSECEADFAVGYHVQGLK